MNDEKAPTRQGGGRHPGSGRIFKTWAKVAYVAAFVAYTIACSTSGIGIAIAFRNNSKILLFLDVVFWLVLVGFAWYTARVLRRMRGIQ